MTIVVGKTEPLKKLKAILNSNGVTRFNSIGEIKAFLKNFESEKAEASRITKIKLDQEIKELKEITRMVIEKSRKNVFFKIIYCRKKRLLTKKTSGLEKNYEEILSARREEALKNMDFIREIVGGIYPLIAGAVGEHLTVKEIEKLSNDHYLINDFSVEFNPPIYNKTENDRIFSIQIDHLLICKSGVFVLETKNWSNKSINNLDLRSPVKQILRTNFALFVLLNGRSGINLARHHWGSVKIPIRNIIVMTQAKPKEEFKRVKVLTLKELNGYIKYFDEIFSDNEVEHIFNFLYNNLNQ